MIDTEITLTTPIEVISSKTNNYLLVIKDFYGKYHYFNHDGTYDGWSHNTTMTNSN